MLRVEKRKETKLIASLATPLLRQGSRQIRSAANVGSSNKPTAPKGLPGLSPDYLPPPSLPPSPRATSLPLSSSRPPRYLPPPITTSIPHV